MRDDTLCQKLRKNMSEITLVLQAIERGESKASEDLLPLVYDELRRLAAARMAQEAAGQTLQPTALVHEAWLQLVGAGERSWQNRAHFFGAAADAMRRILIDKARRKSRLKRGAGQVRLDIDELELAETTPDDNVLLINEALEKLEREDPEQARVVVLKFFGGLTNQEVAENLGVSQRTVERQWACAKARLFRWVRSQN
jgi:RNA polymerase sigma factor (TIGR02999 family)